MKQKTQTVLNIHRIPPNAGVKTLGPSRISAKYFEYQIITDVYTHLYRYVTFSKTNIHTCVYKRTKIPRLCLCVCVCCVPSICMHFHSRWNIV